MEMVSLVHFLLCMTPNSAVLLRHSDVSVCALINGKFLALFQYICHTHFLSYNTVTLKEILCEVEMRDAYTNFVGNPKKEHKKIQCVGGGYYLNVS